MSGDHQSMTDLSSQDSAPYGYYGGDSFPKKPHLLKIARYVLIFNFVLVPVSICSFTSIPDTLLLGVVALEAFLSFIVLPFLFVALCYKGQNG